MDLLLLLEECKKTLDIKEHLGHKWLMDSIYIVLSPLIDRSECSTEQVSIHC